MVRCCKAILTALVLFAACSVASAQEASIGAGKLEVGGFPGGGTFFVGGNDNNEVNFNVYTAGGGLTYYLNPKAAVEGEVTGSIGWAQDVFYQNKKVIHVQMPCVWSYMGNVQLYPGGSRGKHVAFYVDGGAGMIALQSRVPTKQFGYDKDQFTFQNFTAEDLGAGVKLFRGTDAPNWGFRIDYKYMIVNSKTSAPAFFANSKTRGAHRIYVGMLWTWKR